MKTYAWAHAASFSPASGLSRHYRDRHRDCGRRKAGHFATRPVQPAESAGAIGAALPYAIGAKIARPDAPIIVFTGDGALGFHIAEFETARREGLDFLIIVGNDSRWKAEHCIQLRDYGADRMIGCELSECIHYERVAEHLGGRGYCIDLDETNPGRPQHDGVVESWSSDLQVVVEGCLYNETVSPAQSHGQSKTPPNARPSCLNLLIPGAPAPCYDSFLTSASDDK